MVINTVLGARPQFIKAAPVSKVFRKAGIREYLIHTGQHYDHNMSQVFFEELGLSKPDINLGIGSGNHGWQTAQMLTKIEDILLTQKPDYVLVYGDTNSTLAGALAAIKLHIPVAHIEAGLRSFNREMPEEHNRILTDHCADLLFCPTQTAVQNLSREGITAGVHWVGDVMYDAVLQFTEQARQQSTVLKDLGLVSKSYLLTTIHRPSNTDNIETLNKLICSLLSLQEPVVFPIHPRTKTAIKQLKISDFGETNLKMINPVGYLDMLVLEQNARMILTDSGGVQKEAYFFAVPCLTLRKETEWVETVEAGWNCLVGIDPTIISDCVHSWYPTSSPANIFGDGKAADRIVEVLLH